MKYLLALSVMVLFSAAVPVVAGTTHDVTAEENALNTINAFLPSDNQEEPSFYIAEK